MAHKKNATNMAELLLQCVTQPDPMLSMLEWLCTELMEAEVDQQLGAEKSHLTLWSELHSRKNRCNKSGEIGKNVIFSVKLRKCVMISPFLSNPVDKTR